MMRRMGQSERIATNLRRGLVEFCVLGILATADAYGLEMARQLESGGLIAGESTLYPLLARMLEAGLVSSSWTTADNGRPRKYYSITGDGRDTLLAFENAWHPLRDAVDDTLRKAHQRG